MGQNIYRHNARARKNSFVAIIGRYFLEDLAHHRGEKRRKMGLGRFEFMDRPETFPRSITTAEEKPEQ